MTPTRDDIFLKVTEIIEELFEVPASSIKPEMRLSEDLDLDSIDAVDLIVHLQEYVQNRVDPEQFKTVRTVSDIVDAAQVLLKKEHVASL